MPSYVRLLALLSVLILPETVSTFCGFYDEDPAGRFNIIKSNIVQGNSETLPYIITIDGFYLRDEEQEERQIDRNLAEWYRIFCGAGSQDDIYFVVYQANIAQLESLLRVASEGRGSLDFRFKGNDFASYLASEGCTATIDYLIYTRQCEPHVTRGDMWAPQESRNIAQMTNLIERGLRAFKDCKSSWLRWRYAYQIVRLAHYSGDYRRAVELYDYLLPKMDDGDTIMKWWVLGHRAGAMLAMGDEVSAAYLYSLIFANSPSKRETAYQSFRIENDAQWEAVLDMCESEEQRVTVHLIRAIETDSKAVEDMRAIYRLQPDAPDLEGLMIKEIKGLEEDFLGASFREQRGYRPDIPASRLQMRQLYLVEMIEFNQQVLQDRRARDLGFWTVTMGYLQYLSGDFYAARKSFNKAEGMVRDRPELQEQLRAFQVMLVIHQQEQLTDTEERYLDSMRQEYATSFQLYDDLQDFYKMRLAALYAKQGNKGKAFAMLYDIGDLAYNPQLDIIDDLLAIFEKEQINDLEESLVTDQNGDSELYRLHNLKALRLMAVGELAQAKRSYIEVPANQRDLVQVNPFVDRINDCIECDLPDTVGALYTRPELADLLIQYDYRAKADVERGPEYFYQLGLAYYNMSYFGYAWEGFDNFRSGASWYYLKEGEVIPSHTGDFGNREYFDVSRALFYFEKARELAYTKELAARATFWAAKCRLIQYYQDPDNDYSYSEVNIPRLPDAYRDYHDSFLTNYQGTDFYSAVIKECKFMAFYARN